MKQKEYKPDYGLADYLPDLSLRYILDLPLSQQPLGSLNYALRKYTSIYPKREVVNDIMSKT